MINAPDFDHRLLARIARVIAHEFPEGTLLLQAVAIHLTFEHNLGAGGHGQFVQLAEDDFDRASALTTGIIEFGNAKWQFGIAAEKQDGVLPAGNQNRTRFAALEIFFADQPPVFAGRNPHADFVFAMRDDAVGADIDPVAIGITHDDEILGADITAAVMLVHERNGKFEYIDFVIALDIF